MTTRMILTGAVLCAMVVAGPAVGAEPLADKAPAGTLAYAGWAGKSLTFSGSMLGQLVDDPTTGRIFAAIHDAIIRNIRDREGRTAFESAWGMAKIAWKHPIAVVLLGVKPGEKGPVPDAAILIQLGREKAAFAKHLDTILDLVGEDIRITDAAVGNVDYKTFGTPLGFDVSFGYLGKDMFFVATGPETPKRLIELTPEKSLKTDKKFAAAMKAVSGENVQVACYLDIDGLLKAVEALTPPRGMAQVKRIIAAVGIDKVQALAGTIRVIDRGMYTKTKLFTPAPHRGVLLAMAGKPLTDADLAGLPADSLIAGAVNLSPKDAWDQLRESARKIDPNAEKKIVAELDKVGKKMEVSIVEDVLANLGDTWLLASAPSLGGVLTGTVLSVEVKDEAKLKAAAAKITAFVKDRLPPAAMPPRQRRGPIIEALRAGRTEINYVSFAGMRPIIPLSPAWTLYKKRFYLAGWPQVIQAAIAGNGRQPLTKDPAFRKARAKITGKASALFYCNVPAVVRHAYPFILAGWTAAASQVARELNTPISPAWLPSLPKMEKYLWPQISAVSADADGIVFESYGSLPGVGLVAGPMTSPLTVAVLVPALARARHNAKTASNLHMIGMGLHMYAADHDGDFAPDLAALKDYLGGTRMFVSPLSGRKPPKMVGDKLVGEIDYIYVPGANTDMRAADEVILAYERPENHKGRGTYALFGDAHVEWMNMKTFRKALARSQELLKKDKDNKTEDF